MLCFLFHVLLIYNDSTKLTWAKISSVQLSSVESENKAATKGKCLCVSLDPMSSILAWLWFVSKSEAGYNVTVLDGVEDITALVGHEALPSYQHIAVFANRSLPDHQINALEKLQQQLANKLSLSEVICRLHTSLT